MNKVFDSAMVLASVSGFLYCTGAVKWNETLRNLQISPAILEKDTGQLIYTGLMELVVPILLVNILCLSILGMYAYFFLPTFLGIFERNMARKRKLVKLRRFWFGKTKDSLRLVSAKKAIRPILILSITILVATVLLIRSERHGKADAMDILNQISEKDVPTEFIARIEVNGKPVNLYYLDCGSYLCAGIDLESHNIKYVKPEDIYLPIDIPKQLASTSSSVQLDSDVEKVQ